MLTLFSATVVQCSDESCRLKYLRSDHLESHLALHNSTERHVSCPKCHVVCNSGLEDDLWVHYTREHEAQCQICQCQIANDNLSEHLSTEHKFENVWNRSVASRTNPIVSNRTEKVPELGGFDVASTNKSSLLSLSSTASSSTVNCAKCNMSFKSKKLLEKHYFSNHEFQCKFCDLKLDKDLYGDHLRMHLANKKKKT